MRRSRQTLRRRGGRLVQFKLDVAGPRALPALELTQYAATRHGIGTDALSKLASEQCFPLLLSREEEVRLATLATGRVTIDAFRALGSPISLRRLFNLVDAERAIAAARGAR